MLRKICTAIIFVFTTFSLVYSQDSTKKGTFTLSGSADVYYRFNFNNARDSARVNNYTSFTNTQNSLELGMASLKGEYAIGKVDAVLDLGFGKRAQEFSYNDNGSLAAVKQLYLSYSPSDKVKFTMGKWGTHVGYEVLDAYLNRNYSMDYMFSYGPFFHTGLKMDVTLKSNVSFMVGIANPTDMSTASFAKKFALAQFHLASANGKIGGYLNYVGGKDQSDGVSNQVDLVVTGIVSDKFNIGYNGTVRSYKPEGIDGNAWWGSALYLNFDPTTRFGLTARGEYFSDTKGVAGFYNKIFDFTLSGNVRIDNLTIIPEIRLDSGKNPMFYKNDDKLDPTAKSTASFILAATYHF